MKINPESLARASSRHPWRVVIAWLILIVAAGATAGALLGGVLNNDIEFTNEPESVRAQDVIDERFAAQTAGASTEYVIIESDQHTVDDAAFVAIERAIAEHVVPRITRAAAGAGRPAPRIVAGVPVALCPRSDVDAVREWSNRILGHSEYSPNYQRLLERGDARDVGDLLAAGDESDVLARLRRFRDAGASEISTRIVAWGRDRAERIESRRRTEAFLAKLGPELG